MKTLNAGSGETVGQVDARHRVLRKVLLACGGLASVLWVGTDILAAIRYEGYRYADQAVSELSAIGAPTRAFVVPLIAIHSVLALAFGFGVWAAARHGRPLRFTGGLLIGLGIVDVLAPLFPMPLDGNLQQEALHLIHTGLTVLLMLLAIGFGATANGRWFLVFSITTIVVLVLLGAWAGLKAPGVAADRPIPWFGARERINIYGYMLWRLVLAIGLLRALELKGVEP
jgi:hypothetical protein